MTFIAFMILPILLSSYLIVHVVVAKKSINWPSTRGHLVKFDVSERMRQTKLPSSLINDSEKDDFKYCLVKIKYEYEVGGKLYEGSRIHFGKEDAYINPKELASSEFPANLRKDDFVVYYSKRFPRISVLKTGINNLKSHMLTIALTISFGLVVYIIYWVEAKMGLF